MTDGSITEWMQSKPESVKKLMRQFPPGCFVEALISLDVPAPGVSARIVSYTEDDLISVLGVSRMAGVVVRAYCRAEWLKVVGYGKNEVTGEILNEEWVKGIIG